MIDVKRRFCVCRRGDSTEGGILRIKMHNKRVYTSNSMPVIDEKSFCEWYYLDCRGLSHKSRRKYLKGLIEWGIFRFMYVLWTVWKI